MTLQLASRLAAHRRAYSAVICPFARASVTDPHAPEPTCSASAGCVCAIQLTNGWVAARKSGCPDFPHLPDASVLVFVFAIAPQPAAVSVIVPNLPDEQEGLTRTGTERAERDLGVRIEELTGRFSDLEATFQDLAASGVDLVFMDNANSGWLWVEEVIADNHSSICRG